MSGGFARGGSSTIGVGAGSTSTVGATTITVVGSYGVVFGKTDDPYTPGLTLFGVIGVGVTDGATT